MRTSLPWACAGEKINICKLNIQFNEPVALPVPCPPARAAAGSCQGSSANLEQRHELLDGLWRQLLKEEEAQQQARQLLPPALVARAHRLRQRPQHLLDAHPLRMAGAGGWEGHLPGMECLTAAAGTGQGPANGG